jgi:hypothetical protein
MRRDTFASTDPSGRTNGVTPNWLLPLLCFLAGLFGGLLILFTITRLWRRYRRRK